MKFKLKKNYIGDWTCKIGPNVLKINFNVIRKVIYQINSGLVYSERHKRSKQ